MHNNSILTCSTKKVELINIEPKNNRITGKVYYQYNEDEDIDKSILKIVEM